MEKSEKYERAKERVAELKKFYTHLITYIVIMALLFFVDLADGGNWWVHWPAIGWGLFVLMHGISVGFGIGMFGPGWEEKKIKEIMEEEEEK